MNKILSMPKWLAINLVFFILAIYGAFTIDELDYKGDYPDFELFYGDLIHWEPADIVGPYTLHAKYAMAKAGIDTIHNYKVVPLLLSAGTVVVVAMLAVQFTNRWIAAPIAAAALVASHLFRAFDTSAVYDNSWTIFYLLSLYFVGKKWQLVPVFFILGILSKPIIFLYLPSIVCFALFTPTSRRAKWGVIISCGIIFALGLFASERITSNLEAGFDGMELVEGLYEWLFFLFSDLWVAALVPAMMIYMAIYAKQKIPYALALLACLLNVALIGGPIQAFTTDIWNEPYRYVPLVALAVSGLPLLMFNFMRKKVQLKA